LRFKLDSSVIFLLPEDGNLWQACLYSSGV